jgi:hypothetical protein
MLFPDQDLDFLPITDPGSRGQKGAGSRIWILSVNQFFFFRYAPSAEQPVIVFFRQKIPVLYDGKGLFFSKF